MLLLKIKQNYNLKYHIYTRNNYEHTSLCCQAESRSRLNILFVPVCKWFSSLVSEVQNAKMSTKFKAAQGLSFQLLWTQHRYWLELALKGAPKTFTIKSIKTHGWMIFINQCQSRTLCGDWNFMKREGNGGREQCLI